MSTEEYAAPYHGFHLVESPDFAGLIGAYRWFVADPIRFTRSLRWTVEHGHADNFANDYASVAYWYQRAPHAPFPSLPARDEMHPPLPEVYEEARDAFFTATRAAMCDLSGPAIYRVARIGEAYYAGRFAEALAQLRTLQAT